MADPLYSEIFFKGKKQAVVNFLNRGLKGERVSVQMNGEQIVKLLNDLKENGIGMESYVPLPEIDIHDKEQLIAGTNWCYEHYGCRGPMPFDKWQLLYDQDDMLCLITLLETPAAAPIPFLKFINGLDGITVYAYGFDDCTCPSWYQYNGRKDEVVWKDALEDPKFEEYKEVLKTQEDYNPNTVDSETEYKVLEGYVKDLLKELNESFLENKHK